MKPGSTAVIADGMVVALHYTLRKTSGEVIDSSENQDPLVYLHGAGNIIPGLESALEGKCAGDRVQAKVPPAEGYGERDPEGFATVPRSNFPRNKKLTPGDQHVAHGARGEPVVFWIVEAGADEVKIDFNHPLAGETLDFDVVIQTVRAATREEQEHGHVHGPGGHHQH